MKSKKVILIMSSILIVLSLIAIAIYKQKDKDLEADESTMQEESGVQGVEFPYLIEKEKLEITSMFTYSGLNPDADMQECSEVAAIDFKNVSDSFLKNATIRASFSDGSEQIFVIENLPAGKETLAFCVDNQKLLADESCVGIAVETAFDKTAQDDSVEISAEGTIITVENVTENNLSEIDIYYRDVYDDKYFGGGTHKYTIETLPKGEKTTITAEDCIWGVVEVVRVEVNK